jgi:carboxypeptidase Taq
VRRDFEKATRVPGELAADLSRARALGQQDWQAACAANDFARFRDALDRHVELRHRYIACFDGFEHPYDVLLDD